MFICVFTTHYQVKRYINVERIVFFNVSDDGKETYIRLKSGEMEDRKDYVFVKETPEEILKLIAEARNIYA